MSEAAAHGAFDPVAYIQHHLTNACVGCDPATDKPAALADFTVFFLDTFLVSLGTTMLINQYLYEKLPYNPQKDQALITQIALAPVVLLVHPQLPPPLRRLRCLSRRARSGRA